MSDYSSSTQEQPLLVDFKQPAASKQLFLQPPLLTSHDSGWSGIHVEHHCQPKFDTPEHQLTMHSVIVPLNSVPSERWFNGKRKSEYPIAGQIAIIPSGTLHRSAWQEEAQFIVLAVDPSLLEKFREELTAPDKLELIPHFVTQKDPLIQAIAFALKNELNSGNVKKSLYIEQLTTTFAVHLLHKYCVKPAKISTYTGGLPKYKLQQVLDYINAHLDQDIKLTTLSELVGMSQWYFAQMFKQSMAIAPYQYVLQQRIAKAKQLLNYQQAKIIDVALTCGFANQSHFTKHFHKLTGMTPKAYRDR